MKKIGTRLKILIKNTPKKIINRRTVVRFKNRRYSKTKNGYVEGRFGLKSDHPSTKRTPPDHRCLVVLVDKRASKFWVHCTCLAGDTKVLTLKGWKTIYSLLNSKSNPKTDTPIQYIVDGELIEGSAPFYTGTKPTIKMTLGNGFIINATKEHRFLCYVGKEKIWKTVEDIKIDDSMCTNQTDSFTKPINQCTTKVISKQNGGKLDVYDIHVPKIHKFVAESLISHNCEFFTFNLEYALTQHNSSAIIDSNGQPASITNPRNVPYLCKHLAKVLTNKTITNKLHRDFG